MFTNNCLKKTLTAIMVAVFILAAISTAFADEGHVIDYVIHSETGFSGHINTEEDKEYYVELNIFLPGNVYLVIETKVDDDGMWKVHTLCFPEYVVVTIVDKPYAYLIEDYHIYDAIVVDCSK